MPRHLDNLPRSRCTVCPSAALSLIGPKARARRDDAPRVKGATRVQQREVGGEAGKMDREEEVTIIEQVLSFMESNKSHMEGEVSTISAERYTSPERLEREREILFRRFPIVVGFSSELREPGSFLTHNHTGVPILVTRDEH